MSDLYCCILFENVVICGFDMPRRNIRPQIQNKSHLNLQRQLTFTTHFVISAFLPLSFCEWSNAKFCCILALVNCKKHTKNTKQHSSQSVLNSKKQKHEIKTQNIKMYKQLTFNMLKQNRNYCLSKVIMVTDFNFTDISLLILYSFVISELLRTLTASSIHSCPIKIMRILINTKIEIKEKAESVVL